MINIVHHCLTTFVKPSFPTFSFSHPKESRSALPVQHSNPTRQVIVELLGYEAVNEFGAVATSEP